MVEKPSQIVPLAARSLEDYALAEDAARPDFTLGERYLEFSKEVGRLALLGIAGYGFLLKEVVLKGEGQHPFLRGFLHYPSLPLLGLTTLGLSAVLSLLSSRLSTDCMKFQIDILRYVKRRTNAGWSADEREYNEMYLNERRRLQGESIRKGRLYLRAAVFLLAAGTVLTVLTFAVVLLSESRLQT